MKRLIIMVLIASTLVLLAGCQDAAKGTNSPEVTQSPSQNEDEISLSVSQIAEKIKSDMKMEGTIDMAEGYFSDSYAIDKALLEDWKVVTPEVSLGCEEFAVLKLKDTADIDAIKAKLVKRSEAVQQSFKDYIPAQAEIAKEYKIEVRGKIILFVMNAKAQDVVDIFKGLD